MVDKRVIFLVISLLLLTGCSYKRNVVEHVNTYDKLAYVNDGNKIVTTTVPTATTTTTKVATTTKVKTTTHVTESTSMTNQLLGEARNNVSKYKNKIDEMIYYINLYRSELGLNPVIFDYELSVAANVRTLEMHYTGIFEHTRPNGEKWSTVYKECGIKYTRAAENISFGYSNIKEVSEAFKASPTHYKNIVNPDLKYVGIGVTESKGTYYFAQEYKG